MTNKSPIDPSDHRKTASDERGRGRFRRGKDGATIKDVARTSGFSIATVSRVFNNSGPVDDDTRIRIRAVAADLRYVPSPIGRSLSTRKTDAIGLLLPDLFGEFFSEVIRGCDQTAQQNRFHLVVSSSHSNREDIEGGLRTMRGRVDGLVVMSPHVDAGALRANLTQGLPVVLLNCHVDGNAYDSLNIDNYGGALQAVQHLLAHGHRRVAIIKGTENNLDAHERLSGYRAALVSAGVPHDPHLELPGDFSEASGVEAVRRMLAIDDRPTALFASNDSMAIGALSALRDAGLRIPDDVALVGFDDVPVASYLTPALTSVHVGIDRLGVLAIHVLLDALARRGTHETKQTILPTTLSIRESCGCAAVPHPTPV
jgi:LacI family transcriptional regulator